MIWSIWNWLERWGVFWKCWGIRSRKRCMSMSFWRSRKGINASNIPTMLPLFKGDVRRTGGFINIHSLFTTSLPLSWYFSPPQPSAAPLKSGAQGASKKAQGTSNTPNYAPPFQRGMSAGQRDLSIFILLLLPLCHYRDLFQPLSLRQLPLKVERKGQTKKYKGQTILQTMLPLFKGGCP